MEPMLCMQNCALCWIFELQWWFLISILYLIGFQLLMKKLDMILCISICYIRLVVFILVSCPKFDTILEILVRWTTLLTAFSHCLENISSRTFIMHRLMHSALSLGGAKWLSACLIHMQIRTRAKYYPVNFSHI